MRALDTGIGNKKILRIDLIRGVCKVRAFVPGCNTVTAQPGWSSSHARLSASP